MFISFAYASTETSDIKMQYNILNKELSVKINEKLTIFVDKHLQASLN